jgi:hypothetical protein
VASKARAEFLRMQDQIDRLIADGKLWFFHVLAHDIFKSVYTLYAQCYFRCSYSICVMYRIPRKDVIFVWRIRLIQLYLPIGHSFGHNTCSHEHYTYVLCGGDESHSGISLHVKVGGKLMGVTMRMMSVYYY